MKDSQDTSGFSDVIQFFSNLPLLRLIRGGKRPAEKRGVYDARKGMTAADLEREHYNAGVRLGDGLVVLDIDPRNGGTDNLTWLSEAFGRLPDTWTVETAGGGTHYYFKPPTGLKAPLRKRIIAPGVELLAEGCYALIPGSVVNGVRYRFSEGYDPSEVEIAEIPSWLVETGSEEESYDQEPSVANMTLTCVTSSQVAEELFKIHPDCPRDVWVRVGMVLAGLHDELFEVEGFDCERLWHIWSSGGLHVTQSEKYSWKEADSQWKSFLKRDHLKSFVSFGTLIYLANECCESADFDWRPSHADTDTQTIETDQYGFDSPPHNPQSQNALQKGQEDVMRILSETEVSQHTFSSQLVTYPLPNSTNFLTLYNEVIRLMGFHAHELAFAVTKQLIAATCARRGVTTSGRRLVFNALLVGPPRSGKSTALNVFRRLLDTVLPGYTLGWPDSYLGLQKALIDCPNRCMIGDELGANTFAGMNGRANEFTRRNYAVLRGLLAGGDTLDAQVSKRDPVAKVDKVYVSAILNSTERELREALSDGNNANRSDGLTRRFTLFHSEKPTVSRRSRSQAQTISPEVINLLLTWSAAEVPLDGTPSSPPPWNDTTMSLDCDADVLLDTYMDKCNRDLDKVRDDDLRPLMLEAFDKIEDWACMLAFIDGRTVVTVEDVEMSYSWAQIEFCKMENFLSYAEDFHMDSMLKIMVEQYHAGHTVDDRSLKRYSRVARRHLKAIEDNRQLETLMALFEGHVRADNLYYKRNPRSTRVKFEYRKPLLSPKLMK